MKILNRRMFTAPYEFHEYPKWVTLKDGSQMVANNAQEEAVLIGDDTKDEVVEKRRGRPPKG